MGKKDDRSEAMRALLIQTDHPVRSFLHFEFRRNEYLLLFFFFLFLNALTKGRESMSCESGKKNLLCFLQKREKRKKKRKKELFNFTPCVVISTNNNFDTNAPGIYSTLVCLERQRLGTI